MYKYWFPVRLGSITATLNEEGLIEEIQWHWTQIPPERSETEWVCFVETTGDQPNSPSITTRQDQSSLPRGLLTSSLPSQEFFAPLLMSDLRQKIQNYFSFGAPLGVPQWTQFNLARCTAFQREVYEIIATIPHGETRTYGWVAQKLGNSNASRAVGQALRSNPLPILIPCHRVVSSNSLGGFMGSQEPECLELQLKQRLIELEEEFINPLFCFLTPSREIQGNVERIRSSKSRISLTSAGEKDSNSDAFSLSFGFSPKVRLPS